MEITLHCDEPIGSIDPFWASTGFTPATLLLEPDMDQALTYLGSIPNDGLRHVRIHYLLDLVRVQDADTEEPRYDWSRLDAGIDRLVENGLRPFFELMGNPSDTFDDFTDPDQTRAWRRLVGDVARHLQNRYGRDEVESWYFETWNEPDIGFGWEQFRWDVDAFLRYYDACDAGLADVNADLRLGGPGTASRPAPANDRLLFREFVAHCAEGENHLTGESVRLDFLSVHEKGVMSNVEDVTPDTGGIVANERAALAYVRENHPELADIPLLNDECDAQTGWRDVHTWRARPYYAAFVARAVDQHLRLLVDEDECDYRVMSPDNGFLGSWGHRTHLTRFGESELSGATVPDHHPTRPRFDEFEFVKKPVHNVMTALSLLGDERIAVDGPDADAVGVVATIRSNTEVAALVYHAVDAIDASGEVDVDLRIEGVPFDEGALAHYRVDREHGNPFSRWEALGAPKNPSGEELEAMRREQELATIGEPRRTSVSSERVHLSFSLPLPGVSLVHLVADPGTPPERPSGLRVETYRGLTPGEDVLFAWNDVDDRALHTYEVCHAEDPDGPFRRVNDVDFVSTAYLHATGAVDHGGYYAVRAVDYWGRTSERSDPITVE